MLQWVPKICGQKKKNWSLYKRDSLRPAALPYVHFGQSLSLSLSLSLLGTFFLPKGEKVNTKSSFALLGRRPGGIGVRGGGGGRAVRRVLDEERVRTQVNWGAKTSHGDMGGTS